jgi:nucleoid DNA-binding protein
VNLNTAAEALSQRFLRNRQESKRLLRFLFSEIAQSLTQTRRVYFRGFGSFQTILRPARKYRNFKTNQIETRPAHKDVRFLPGKDLLKQIRP